jgi:hypothetical protein
MYDVVLPLTDSGTRAPPRQVFPQKTRDSSRANGRERRFSLPLTQENVEFVLPR